MNTVILKIQITSDLKILLDDIKAGLYNGRLKDEQKEWEKLIEKIQNYQILKEQERETRQILNEEN